MGMAANLDKLICECKLFACSYNLCSFLMVDNESELTILEYNFSFTEEVF